MVFKKIEVFGFKSFADKLEVDLRGGVTCIVGPNGCGKSNVSDAVRWVLGEQSSKVLRGTQMQDVIFKGTQARNQLGYCEVSLHFDNSAGTFPIDYSEVVISRKLYRSGEGEYFINRKQARLKDINMLLHDSGIDRDGLSIISQGQVGEIINSKPEQRRSIFEEAAQIAKFKTQKADAERKLEKASLDITRVNDVLGEIDRTLGPLLRQAETAEKYLDLSERLKNLEIKAYIAQYDSAAEQKSAIASELNAIDTALKQKQAQVSEMAEQANQAMERVSDLDKRSEQLQGQVLALSLDIERSQGERRLVQEKLALLQVNDANIKTEIAVLQSRLETEMQKQSEAKIQLERLVETLNDLKEQYKTAEVDVNEKSRTASELEKLRLERAQLESKQKTIQGLLDSGEGFRYSVKKIIEQKSRFTQIVGVVAKELTVAKEHETAIEVALGASAQNIITKDELGARAMIEKLKEQNWGRATFLPITAARVRALNGEERTHIAYADGLVGIASELVQYNKKIEPVVLSLLGRVAVVDELSNAIELARAARFAFKIVTLDGDVIEPRGSITGGSKNAQSNNLWHASNLESINNSLEEVNEKIAKLEKAGDINVARENLTALKIKIAATESEISSTELMLTNHTNAILLQKAAIDEKQTNQNFIGENITQANTRDDDEKDYYSATLQLESVRAEIENVHAQKDNLRKQIVDIDYAKVGIGDQIVELTQKYYQVESKLARVDIGIEQMQQRIEEEYGLNYSGCFAYLQEKAQNLDEQTDDFVLESAMRDISSLKRQISALGPVNIEAIEQSRDSKSRYDDYSTQVADLESAKADLEKVINTLSIEMESKFKDSFEKINHNFGVAFKELFGGGHARLELVPIDGKVDWLNSGIDIIAEPPGKKLSNLSLLSGGEKALTAIAILFAILKLRPMPFCLLDEIEAALDEANVTRFATYLQKFSKTTQFIVITHRKPTMELADNLYGVTMEEKGVSKLISVKLEQWDKSWEEETPEKQAVHA